jgi:hypothetical protein
LNEDAHRLAILGQYECPVTAFGTSDARLLLKVPDMVFVRAHCKDGHMRVLMLTNTYLPSICGVARSVETFAQGLRARGHDVFIIAPQYDDCPDTEDNVLRVPALQNFVTSDAAVRLPIPGYLTSTLKSFEPKIVHVHHPFLFGETCLRVGARFNDVRAVHALPAGHGAGD